MAECIDREATIKRIKEVYCVGCNSYNGVRCRACGTGDAIDMIEDAQAADVAPVVHGRWIDKEAPAARRYFECSNCGAHENKHTAIKGYYCWRCGAKMDESEGV